MGGGVPTGAGLVDRGVDQGPWLQERVGGGVGAGWQFHRATGPVGWGGLQDSGTGPRNGANFATCVVFLMFGTRTKRRKMTVFLKDALWGGGAYKGSGGVQGLRFRGGRC